MKPIEFPEQTKKLEGRWGIDGLPIWGNGSVCVSCWKPSLRERLVILFGGPIWVSVLSGKTQPPIAVAAMNKFFKHANWKSEMPKKIGWYQVKWGPEEPPVTVYVNETNKDYVIWGWDEKSELSPLQNDQCQQWGTTWLSLGQ